MHNKGVSNTLQHRFKLEAERNGHTLARYVADPRTGWSKRVPDSQRRKLYTAELVIRSAAHDVSFRTSQELVDFVRKVENDDYVRVTYGVSHRRVNFKARMHRTANGGETVMNFPANVKWAWNRSVVLHEIAHGFASPYGDPGHGWLFCHIFADLVGRFMGSSQKAALLASFKKHGVKHEVPKAKRVVAPEQLERLAAARAARGLVSIEPHVFLVKGFVGSGWRVITQIEANPVKRGGQVFDLNCGWRADTGVQRASEKGVADMMARLTPFASRYSCEVKAVPLSEAKELLSR